MLYFCIFMYFFIIIVYTYEKYILSIYHENESRKIGYLNIFIICHHCIKNFQDHSLWSFHVTFHFKTNLLIYIMILN